MRPVLSAPIALAIAFAAFAGGCGDGESSIGSGGASTSGTGGAGATGTGGTGNIGGIETLANCDPASTDTIEPLVLTPIAQGLFQPVLAKSPPEDPTRLFIVQKDGVIRVVKDGVLLPDPFVDVGPLLQFGGQSDERGLLGLAFAPDYEQSGRFYLHYTNVDTQPDGRIAAFSRSAENPDLASSTVDHVVLDIPQPFANHNGGSLEFSPVDGMLYVGLGDGGSANDPMGNGQALDTLLGKILRIDVSTAPYGIPDGNPTVGRPEIWDWGVRNPWRISFDLCTGDLYIADVGQNQFEEVNFEPPLSGGRNYGWNYKEGFECFGPQIVCDANAPLTDPVAVYSHSQGCSISGGYVYRGDQIPSLRGHYLYGDFCSGKVWALRVGQGDPIDLTALLDSADTPISSFGQDANGELYLCSLSGTVYQLAPGKRPT